MSQPQPVAQFRRDIEKMGEQFQNVLPSHITPEKFQRVVVTAIQNSPGLLSCSRESLMGACMRAAQDGLLPDGREGAIVKFGGDAQWMPMTAGLLKKARNSGELESLAAEVVYAGDEFTYWIDEKGPHLRHVPEVMRTPGEPQLAYAVARVAGGGVYIEVMRKEQIEKVRDVSRQKNSGPWKDWQDEMWRKTVIRRLSKRLPMSSDLEQVVTRDDDQYEIRDMGQAQEVRRGIQAIHAATQEDVDPDGPIPGLDDIADGIQPRDDAA